MNVIEKPVRIVSGNDNLIGVIHQPQTHNIRGAIVFIHGYFSSHKIGPASLYVQLSRMFAVLGYIALRFDCVGVGDSPGDFIKSTYDLRLKNYQDIITYCNRKFNSDNIILCAHSMGALLAIDLALQNNKIEKIILISPAIGKFTGKEPLISDRQRQELNTKGIAYRAGIPVTKQFVEKMCEEEYFIKAGLVPNRVFIGYGIEDQFYDIQTFDKCGKSFNNCEIASFDNADHNFLDNDSRQQLFSRISEFL